jgi:hypothetical protein
MKRGTTFFFGLALLCTVAVSPSVAAQAPEPGSNQSSKQSMMIAIPVDYEGQIPGSLILAESVRKYAGALCDVPIRIFIPSGLAPAMAERKERLAGLDVKVSEVRVPDEASSYILGAKPFLAAQAEREAEDTDLVVILAPNTIMLRSPTAFLLPQGVTLGYSTVHHQNIGSLASELPDAFWDRLYQVLDVSDQDVFTNETLADKVTVRFYFNAGGFVVRPSQGLMEAWAQGFQKLIGDTAMAELCAEGPRNVFLHQAALAAVALKRLRPPQMVELPDSYSYPLFFERFHGGLLTFDSLEDVVTMRYEFRSDDLPVGWEAQVNGPPDVLAWIAAQLAAYGTESK